MALSRIGVGSGNSLIRMRTGPPLAPLLDADGRVGAALPLTEVDDRATVLRLSNQLSP
jgi:hypothetical protein